MDLEAGKSKNMTLVFFLFPNVMFVLIICKFHIMHPNHMYFQFSQVHPPHACKSPLHQKRRKMKTIPSLICVAHILTENSQTPRN